MANPSLQIGNNNWAIKEDNLLGYSTAGTRFVPQPITMTRASAGTRVNPQGLVETVELLGSEEVTNGDFGTDSDWNKTGTWSIESNYATANGNSTSQYIQQDFTITNGKTYLFTYEVIENTLNGNGASLSGSGGFVSVSLSSVIGTHQVYITADDSGAVYALKIGVSGTATTGTIKLDNVSIKESTKNNLARVDYDGSVSSLLAEPQRTNLIPYSEDFSQWNGTQVTIEPNAIISPDGTLNASRMTPTTTSSVHLISTSGSTTMAMSVYAKSNGYHRFRFNSGSSGNGYASFDLNAGTVLNSGGTYYTSSSIDSVGNGWYRCTLVLTSGVASVPNLAIEDNSGNVSFIGDGTSAIYIWGGQAEVGSYATSYIPTDGGTVTRVQDQYSKTGISDKINSEEGVLFLEVAALSDNDGTYRSLSISDSSRDNEIEIDYTNDEKIRVLVKSGGGTIFSTSFIIDTTLFNKVAVKYKLNDFAVFINGTEEYTLTSGAIPIGLNRLAFDRGDGGTPFFAKVKQLQVFKTALTDPELATLTT